MFPAFDMVFVLVFDMVFVLVFDMVFNCYCFVHSWLMSLLPRFSFFVMFFHLFTRVFVVCTGPMCVPGRCG
jgi:hypothetical protein